MTTIKIAKKTWANSLFTTTLLAAVADIITEQPSSFRANRSVYFGSWQRTLALKASAWLRNYAVVCVCQTGILPQQAPAAVSLSIPYSFCKSSSLVECFEYLVKLFCSPSPNVLPLTLYEEFDMFSDCPVCSAMALLTYS